MASGGCTQTRDASSDAQPVSLQMFPMSSVAALIFGVPLAKRASSHTLLVVRPGAELSAWSWMRARAGWSARTLAVLSRSSRSVAAEMKARLLPEAVEVARQMSSRSSTACTAAA